jgi:hypothetical protein
MLMIGVLRNFLYGVLCTLFWREKIASTQATLAKLWYFFFKNYQCGYFWSKCMAKLWQFGSNKLRRSFWRSHKHVMAFLPNSSLLWPILRSEFSIFSGFHLWSYVGDMFFHDPTGSLGIDYIQSSKKIVPHIYLEIFSYLSCLCYFLCFVAFLPYGKKYKEW